MFKIALQQVAAGNNQSRDINILYVAKKVKQNYLILGWRPLSKNNLPEFLSLEECGYPLSWDYTDPTGLKKYLTDNNLNTTNDLILIREKIIVGYNEKFLNLTDKPPQNL